MRALGRGRAPGGSLPDNLPNVAEISEIFRSGNRNSQAAALHNLLHPDDDPDAGMGSGAAAAAGVLTAVDEDQEADEEATAPGEFDYHSDNEDEEE